MSDNMELVYPGKRDPSELIEKVPRARCTVRKSIGSAVKRWRNRLYHGDNLPVLKHLLSDSAIRGRVQLVYIDPPYSTQQSFSHRRHLGSRAYDDQLSSYAYVDSLRARLILLRELLAEDGSIYVHLDDKMIFHIKVVMDELFGSPAFRNLIVRKKCHSKNFTRKQYGNTADYILFYGKGRELKWNRPYERENIYTFEQRFPKVDPKTGRRFALVPVHAPGTRNGETGKPWRDMSPPAGKHWQVSPAELDRLDAAGEIYWSPTGNPRRKIFADGDRGVPVQDVWLKYMDFQNQNMRETGYPTEKNPALLRRILEASSDPEDLVLDAYCGSGTTLDVARQLGRRWIGIDSGELAVSTSAERLAAKPVNELDAKEQMALFDAHAEDHTSSVIFDGFEVIDAEATLD